MIPNADNHNLMETEEQFLDFTCPMCQAQVSYPQSAAGSLQECPDCLQELLVPQPGSETGRMIPIPIQTSRLSLRRLTEGDAEAFMKMAADEEFFLYQESDVEREMSVLRWLEPQAHAKLRDGNNSFGLAVELQSENRLIGVLGFRLVSDSEATLDQIYVDPPHRRKGFAMEAIDAWLGFCFEELRLHRVTVAASGQDTASCRLVERVGLRREGELIKNVRLPDGSWGNTVWFAALEEEYLESPPGAAKSEKPASE